jgi:hypothetical protein
MCRRTMNKDNRRSVVTGLRAASLLSLSGCETESKPSASATLVNREAIHKAVNALVEAADNLARNVSDLDTEDWKDVVPDVQAAASTVTTAVLELKKTLGYSDAS